MEFLVDLSQDILALIFCLGTAAIFYGIPIYIVYRLVRRLIRYNAEYKYRYNMYRQAESDLNDVEDDLNEKERTGSWAEK